MPGTQALRLEAYLRAAGPTPAAVLTSALRISQPTLSRAVTALGPAVVRLGHARATHYALAQSIGAHGSTWPVYRIDAQGRASPHGSLTALHGDGCAWWAAAAAEFWTAGSRPPGAFPNLPWFLADQRPNGFLGEQFARAQGAALGAPASLAQWRTPHVLAALLAHGDDLPGNFVLGAPMLERVQRARLQAPEAIDVADRAARYAERAAAAMAGNIGTSSAGGEFPKFLACLRTAPDTWRHVLVKFSDSTNSPAKRRWVDLLIAEHHAAQTLAAQGLAAAATELVVAGERLCLEVTRFDRVGVHGRRGVVSLAALDDALHGQRDHWPQAAARLARDGWIDGPTRATIELLHDYGQLIANTDMHFGNLSFLLDDRRPLALAPTYDMLPMLYRPATTGEVVPREFQPPLPAPDHRETWHLAAQLAITFWRRLEGDARVSVPFRKTCAENVARIERARAVV